MNRSKFKGILPVLSTPLNKDGSIDAEGLKNLVEFLIKKGAVGFWALGTGSEDMNLSFQKRIEVARIVSEKNAGRIPILLGSSFYAFEDTLSFIDETNSFEIDGYHFMVYHNLLGLDRVEWLYRYIAEYSSKPIWMYSSANYGRWLPPEFVYKLRRHSNIVGIKYSTSNTVHAAKVIMMHDDDFQVITSVATTLLSSLSMGSKACTTSIASCLPEILVKIYNLYQNGDMVNAYLEQKKLIQFLSEFPKKLREDNFFQAAEEKYILSLRGICKEYTSSYYRDLNNDEKDKVNNLLTKYQVIPVN